MIMRFRAVSAAAMTLVLGLCVAAAGCGKYSVGTLKAIKSFKDGNLAYAQKDWKKSVEKYEAVVEHEDSFAQVPQLATAYFFLGNSYIQLAIENYRKAADKNADKQWKKSSLEYLAAAYGPDKLNDAAKAEPVYK